MRRKIEIQNSEKKLLWISLGALLLVLTSIFLLYKANEQIKWDPLLLKFVGTIGLFFFSYCFFVGIKKIVNQKNKPGLVIDDKKIYLNPDDHSHHILIKDITKINDISIFSNKFILVFVENAEDYIKKENKTIRKQLMKNNYSNYGTPFTISLTALQIDYKELKTILENIQNNNL